MFGTVAHMRVKPGQEEALRAINEEWHRTRGTKVKGAIGGYVFKSEKKPNEYIMVAIFQDRDSYYANAKDPDQDRWYRKMRDLLESDPTWEDGEIINTMGQVRQAGT